MPAMACTLDAAEVEPVLAHRDGALSVPGEEPPAEGCSLSSFVVHAHAAFAPLVDDLVHIVGALDTVGPFQPARVVLAPKDFSLELEKIEPLPKVHTFSLVYRREGDPRARRSLRFEVVSHCVGVNSWAARGINVDDSMTYHTDAEGTVDHELFGTEDDEFAFKLSDGALRPHHVSVHLGSSHVSLMTEDETDSEVEIVYAAGRLTFVAGQTRIRGGLSGRLKSELEYESHTGPEGMLCSGSFKHAKNSDAYRRREFESASDCYLSRFPKGLEETFIRARQQRQISYDRVAGNPKWFRFLSLSPDEKIHVARDEQGYECRGLSEGGWFTDVPCDMVLAAPFDVVDVDAVAARIGIAWRGTKARLPSSFADSVDDAFSQLVAALL